LDSPSFHKHSHCLDQLFSPTNKKSKLNHWSKGIKGKLDIFNKKENLLDFGNPFLFKDSNNNSNDNSSNNDSSSNNDKNNTITDNIENDINKIKVGKNASLHNSNIQKKERVKSEPNLYHSPEVEVNKKNLRMPKYNTLVNFEKIPFDKTNINFEELKYTKSSDDSILGKRKYSDINKNTNKMDNEYTDIVNYTINKNQSNKMLNIVKSEFSSDNDIASCSSNKENSRMDNNLYNGNGGDKGKAKVCENDIKLKYKKLDNNKDEGNNPGNKIKKLLPNINNNILEIKNKFSQFTSSSTSSIKNIFNNKKIKLEPDDNKNKPSISSFLNNNSDNKTSKNNNYDNKSDNRIDDTKIKQENNTNNNDEFEDEFGFFDIGIFNEEIDEIVSKYDSKISNTFQVVDSKGKSCQDNISNNDNDNNDDNDDKKVNKI